MIKFATTSTRTAGDFRLVYRREEFSFDSEPSEGGRGIAVTVNDVQLFVDDEGQVIYVAGYCPYQAWEPTSSSPPDHSLGGLTVLDLNPAAIPSGMAFGVNDLTSRWPVFINQDGWVCIGEPTNSGERAVEFAPSSVAVLRGGTLVALWLRPAMLGN